MGAVPTGRVALMSIHPEFANAILSGEKEVEFRKRPVAADVSYVLIYATMPIGLLVGWFGVEGQNTESPTRLWSRFKDVACISKERFFDYYSERSFGTGIRVARAGKFDDPVPLNQLGALRPPQSFQYLSAQQMTEFINMIEDEAEIEQNNQVTF